MPELPEVETVVRSLRPYLTGRKIVNIEVLKDKSFPDISQQNRIIDHKITSISRRAKLIIINFESSYHLVTHLKMTGQLLYQKADSLAGGGHPTSDILQQLPGKHTRVIHTLDDGSHLYFNDLRIFGWQRIMDDTTLDLELAAYGPDAHRLTDLDTLQSQFSRISRPIKQVLMDNKIMSGIGNIYAAEICYACHLSPKTPTKNLTRNQIQAIMKAAHDILEEAISYGGTTFDGRYVDADGKGGNYESMLHVYGRVGESCHTCGATLVNVKIGGRSTVYCPECQP